MKDIVIAGIAGSGKGTQARALEKHFGHRIQYFEPGSIFRAFTSNDNIIGDYTRSYTSVGKLLPNAFIKSVLGLVFASLQPGSQLLVDGFPRMFEQKDMFDETMKEQLREFIVFHLVLSDEDAKTRLAHRKICPVCGTTYSDILSPGIMHCTEDQTLLTTRIDDTSDSAIAERFHLYHTETKPIIDAYDSEGKVIHLDGTASIDTITTEILKHL